MCGSSDSWKLCVFLSLLLWCLFFVVRSFVLIFCLCVLCFCCSSCFWWFFRFDVMWLNDCVSWLILLWLFVVVWVCRLLVVSWLICFIRCLSFFVMCVESGRMLSRVREIMFVLRVRLCIVVCWICVSELVIGWVMLKMIFDFGFCCVMVI